MISIKGLPKGAVLQALYNAARPGQRTAKLTLLEAESFVEHLGKRKLRFLEVNGRTLRVDLSGDALDGSEFDKANGVGVAKKAIAPLKAGS